MQYLGDGVYGSFDGFQIWLHVGRHDAEPCVALEPNVIKSLNDYWESIQLLVKSARRKDPALWPPGNNRDGD
jgi:hypothetical protein